MTIKERVACGIEWLDYFGPDNWRTFISIDHLDVGCMDNCVLAQIYGSWDESRSRFEYDPIEYGFDGGSPNYLEDCNRLTEEWVRCLT